LEVDYDEDISFIDSTLYHWLFDLLSVVLVYIQNDTRDLQDNKKSFQYPKGDEGGHWLRGLAPFVLSI
jgi:hypothetical protein